MSVADELSKLDALRAQGVLSQSEFQHAKQRLLDGPLPSATTAVVNSFRRSRSDRWIGGVCGGLALSTGLESWIWRLIFTILLLFGGTGFVLYLLIYMFAPAE